MVRSQISIRLENNKIAQLKTLAKYNNKTYVCLIRDQINLLLLNGVNYESRQRVKKICKELRGRFAYIKSYKGQTKAIREKATRETIAKKIEGVFGL